MHRLALPFLTALAACTPASQSSPALKAATEDAAVHVVRAFLDAAQAGDATQVAARMCGAPSDALARATAALQGPLRIHGYEVTRVEPAWVGAEPYHRVEVTLRRAAPEGAKKDVDARSLSVRAREGCVDRLLGEPIEGAKPPDLGEISL
jgi:hypothetical protein